MPFLDLIAIDLLLPQTQCAQCGFPGCLPYAEAIASGAASINRCAPGGDDGIRALANFTGLRYAALDPAHGVHKPRMLAVIDESRCIGCTICIQKCPVDAIAGAAKLMHTVIADECTGCELCLAPCPVDCIALIPATGAHPAMVDAKLAADVARRRYRFRRERLERLAQHADARRQKRAAPISVSPDDGEQAGASLAHPVVGNAAAAVGSAAHKHDAIAAALARARARRDSATTR